MKRFITFVTCAAFALSPALYADEAPPSEEVITPPEQQEAPAPAPAPAQNEAPPVAQVGKAAEDGSNTGKSSHWGQIALATGAIAIAVVALVLVSKNKGSHTSKS